MSLPMGLKKAAPWTKEPLKWTDGVKKKMDRWTHEVGIHVPATELVFPPPHHPHLPPPHTALDPFHLFPD